MSFVTEHLTGRPQLVRRVFEAAGLVFPRAPKGSEWRVLCPFHDDHDPSMDVNLEKAAYVCRSCAAGGDAVEFFAARTGLTLDAAIADIRDRLGIGRNGSTSAPIKSWAIRDVDGKLVATHHFHGFNAAGKKILPWDPKGIRTADLPLYGCERLAAADHATAVILVEGEKATDALLEQGFAAVGTVTGASGTPGPAALEVLRGRDVVLWPDNDDAGRQHMDRIASRLQGARRLSWGERPKDDAFDFFARGGTAAQLKQLLAEAAPVQGKADPPSQETHLSVDRDMTDLWNAKRFVDEHRESVRYVHDARRWHVWDGRRWAPDATREADRLAKATIEGLWRKSAAEPDADRRKQIRSHARASESAARIRSLLDLAASERPVSALSLAFDADPWLLNCDNGTIDLRSGSLQPHRREDMIAKLAPVAYDPEARSPLWDAFLERIMAGNADLIAFLQRAGGYTLTGDTSAHKFFVTWGSGRNGKSTLLRTWQAMLGDYAVSTSIETLVVKRGTGASNDVARLAGARFVSAVEAEEGQRLAEERVKQLTGGDSIAARFLYQEHFEFRPTFKLWLATNHRPHVRGTDEAIWRRIDLIPFTVCIPETEQDPRLPEKLQAELPGILTWAVTGCLRWQAKGLAEPDGVRNATAEYRREEDLLGDFIDECCYLEPNAATPARELYAAYTAWCQRSGEKAPLSQKKLGPRLRERNLEPARDTLTGRAVWRGVGLEPNGGLS